VVMVHTKHKVQRAGQNHMNSVRMHTVLSAKENILVCGIMCVNMYEHGSGHPGSASQQGWQDCLEAVLDPRNSPRS
jgi:uncharacterized pyridoxal phosphate-containing UPF0001 family protein